jgi:phosphatidylinositol glycan class B
MFAGRPNKTENLGEKTRDHDLTQHRDDVGKLKAGSPEALLLIAIFLIALILRVEVATHFPTIEWPDEIFNTLEPAHHLAYGYGVVVWEWRRGVRSWVFPAFLAGVMRATDWMGQGSHGYLTAIVIVLSLLSLTTVWFGYAWSERSSGKVAAIIAAGACATWYQLVYFAPKAFTEVVAADFLLPGLYLGMYEGELPEKKRLFLAGLSLGAALSLRMQLLPAVAFAVLYFCHKKWKSRGPAIFAGLLLPVLAFGLVDAITWSYPFQSYLRYLRIVVLEGRNYGTSPWYWYLVRLLKFWGPMLLLALAGVRRNALLGWVTLIIVASHSVIGHKEIRFLYPAAPLLMTLAALGFVEITSAFNARRKSPLPAKAIMITGLIFFSLASGFFAWPFHWKKDSGGLIAMDRLSGDPSVCGVGLDKLHWAYTGGYVHLHRNVPILLVDRSANLERQMLNFNALVTMGRLTDPKMGFTSTGCWNGVCLYRRPGPCLASPPYYEVNEMLRLSDQ